MLRLSKKADYGLIALRHVARLPPGGSASAKEIAASCGMPLPLLSKILQILTRRGFLNAVHGTNGGYRLARKSSEISALEVILAIDGPVILASCFNERGDCTQSPTCTVRTPLRRIHEGILTLLGSIMLSEIAEEPEGAGAARVDVAAIGAVAGGRTRWKGSK